MHHNNQQSGLAFIGLGSNMGDRELLLRKAVCHLHNPPSVNVIRCSSIYETEPVGYVDQSPFLNMVISVRSEYSPHELFACMRGVEEHLGRTREIRWGPRTIDLDLLMVEDVKLSSPDLMVPHPRMYERLFVLIPLMEVIESDHTFELVNSWFKSLDGKDEVILWKRVNWHKELGRFVN